ncbi:MAG: hypothetical protein Q8S33_30670 [Myxococcales bacterium]|nr:hypothetical protein [Myxococcales bacterium]
MTGDDASCSSETGAAGAGFGAPSPAGEGQRAGRRAATSTEVTMMGVTSSIRSSTNSTRVFEFNTALSQGAALGVVASF